MEAEQKKNTGFDIKINALEIPDERLEATLGYRWQRPPSKVPPVREEE